MKKITLMLLFAIVAAVGMQAKKMSDLKIYINPGHGGYTSNDRPIHLYPFPANDSLGYWESKSNLYKGLHMYHILDSLGATPYLSRIKNTEADDRSLSGIAAEANNLGVDLFFSIHSNAGEDVNYPLMLYRENTIGTPRYPENITLSKILWKNLHSNKLPVWTRDTEYVEGDLTFYQNMWQGGLGVLRTLYVVGLLSEGGMHEHRPEAYRLMNDDYWWLEAWHFVRSIMEFYDTEDRFVTGNVAGIVYDNHNLREKDMPVAFHNYKRDTFAPINYATVELLGADGKVVQKRTTDNMYNGVFVFRNVAPGKYKLRTSHGEYYTEEADVEVVANEVSYQDMPLTMKREFPLAIVKYSPMVAEGEQVSCASVLEFEFNTDVDVDAFEKAFSIEPPVDGYFRYSNTYHKAVFTPTLSFDLNTKYKVTISTEAKHTDGYYSHPNMESPVEFSFETRGRNRLELIDNFPADNGTVHYAAPSLEFRFDKSIDPASIYDYVKITDSKGAAVSVNKRGSKFNQLSNDYGNVVFAVSGNLKVGETYNVSLSGDLRDREQLPMVDDVKLQFTAIDAAVDPDGVVFEPCEDAASFAYVPEQTKGIGSTLPTCIRSTSSKLFDKSSYRFSYKFTDNHDGEVVWHYNGAPHQFNAGDKFGMYVNGDFNNHELYVGFTSGTDTKYTKICDLDFLGWQYKEVSLDMLENGFTYIFSDIRLVQKSSPITQNGTFGIDNLFAKENSGISDAVVAPANGIEVYPLPASDFINVSSEVPVASLELSNAAGAIVRKSENASSIGVAGLPAGVYMLRVVLTDGSAQTVKVPVAG